MELMDFSAQDVRDIQNSQRNEVINRILNEIRDQVTAGGFTVDVYTYNGPIDEHIMIELGQRGFQVTGSDENTYVISWA